MPSERDGRRRFESVGLQPRTRAARHADPGAERESEADMKDADRLRDIASKLLGTFSPSLALSAENMKEKASKELRRIARETGWVDGWIRKNTS